MKRGIVYCGDRLAGELVEDGGTFVFRYAPEYLAAVLAGGFGHLAQNGGGVPGGPSLCVLPWLAGRRRAKGAAVPRVAYRRGRCLFAASGHECLRGDGGRVEAFKECDGRGDFVKTLPSRKKQIIPISE